MRRKTFSIILLAALFVVAGTLHFTHAETYTRVMPPYLPHPLELVYVSGFCEILGGVGILLPRFRRLAGWGLMLLLVGVFPANVHMAVNGIGVDGAPASPFLLWLRLPLQAVLILWVWWSTKERREKS